MEENKCKSNDPSCCAPQGAKSSKNIAKTIIFAVVVLLAIGVAAKAILSRNAVQKSAKQEACAMESKGSVKSKTCDMGSKSSKSGGSSCTR